MNYFHPSITAGPRDAQLFAAAAIVRATVSRRPVELPEVDLLVQAFLDLAAATRDLAAAWRTPSQETP